MGKRRFLTNNQKTLLPFSSVLVQPKLRHLVTTADNLDYHICCVCNRWRVDIRSTLRRLLNGAPKQLFAHALSLCRLLCAAEFKPCPLVTVNAEIRSAGAHRHQKTHREGGILSRSYLAEHSGIAHVMYLRKTTDDLIPSLLLIRPVRILLLI